MTFLDSNIVIWLAGGLAERLTPGAIAAIEREPPLISPVVSLELTYLWEVGRLPRPPAEIIDQLRRDIGLRVAAESTVEVVAAAALLTWTRDPFDRLICGHAIAVGGTLVTADRMIRANFPAARG